MSPLHPLICLAALVGLSACSSLPAGRAPTGDVTELMPGARWEVADMEAATPLVGDTVVVPKPAQPRVPASDVRARRETDGSLTLQWREAWYAALRLHLTQPLDLRGALDDATLELDWRSDDMARAGLHVGMACGPDCVRKVNLLRASRAAQGQGWQQLALPLRCFVRDGADFRAIAQPFFLDSSGSGTVQVARVRLVRQGRPSTGCPDYRSESVTPVTLDQVWAMDWWMPRHEKKLQAVREAVAAGRPPQLVFIGDSITHGWEDAGRRIWDERYAPLDALDLGYGGDKTENVLWRLQHGEIDGFQARVVVLMIGTNNTGDRQEDPATTAAGVRRLLDEIRARQPAARVLLLAVFPRDAEPGTRLRRLNDRLNQHLAGFADGERISFLDLQPVLAEPDGRLSTAIFPDLLHLSEDGYRRWADGMAPTLQRLLSAGPLR